MIFYQEFFESLIKFLTKLPMAALTLIVGLITMKILLAVVKKSVKIARIPKDLRGIAITLSKFGMWSVLLVVLFFSLGFGRFAYILSGSAIVLVFLLNNSIAPLLGNIFSGIFLVGDPHIGIGKKIITNDGKTKGVIEGIDMRKIRIRDKDGNLHVVPNSTVENSEWVVVEENRK